MNRLLLSLLLMTFIVPLKAQYLPKNLPTYDEKAWHFGFSLGINVMNFNIHPVDQASYDTTLRIMYPNNSMGFNIGIVANKRLVKYLDLRFVPTLSFGERSLEYYIVTSPNKEEHFVKTVESTFLDLPLTLKYKSKRFDRNLNNIRTFVLGGVRYSYDLASQKKKKGTSDDVVIKLNPHDFMVTGGVGFDFYMKYFKFGVELQMAYGLVNVLDQENTIYTTNIDKLSSKMAWITFTFE